MDNILPIENASTKGCLNGHQKVEKFECKVKTIPLDIIVYVPGTTDPVNSLEGKGNAADICYWVTNPNLVTLIEDLRHLYNNVYVNIDFSWSGDNSITKRTESGENLVNYLVHYYSGIKDTPVTFHLIGHSHGGNVINEFTQKVNKHPEFPSAWKIKSITYLSTPFFETLHPINLACKSFHKQIRINNVYNDFDLTQRVVADFSMKQAGLLTDAFQKSAIISKAKKTLHDINPDVYAALKPSTGGILASVITTDPKYVDKMTVVEARPVWNSTLSAVEAVNEILLESSEIFRTLNGSHPHFITNKINENLQNVVGTLRSFFRQPIINLKNRIQLDVIRTRGATTGTSVYSRTALAQDLMVFSSFLQAVRFVNNFMDFRKSDYLGEFTSLLNDILLHQIDKFDNTMQDPKHQIKGQIPTKYIPVRKYDPYNKLKDTEFDKFIKNMETLENVYSSDQSMKNRMQILFTFIAELNYKPYLDMALRWVDRLQWPAFGDIDKELKRLDVVLTRYKSELDNRHCGIAYEPDEVLPTTPTVQPIPKGLEMCPNPWVENIKNPTPRVRPFVEQRGSLGYLAVTSHSISRLTLYDEVKAEIVAAFETDLKSKVRKPENIVLKKVY